MALYIVVGCNKVAPYPLFASTSFEECAKRLQLSSLSEKDMKEKTADAGGQVSDVGYDYILCEYRVVLAGNPRCCCSCPSKTYIIKCPDGEIAKMMAFVQRELVI